MRCQRCREETTISTCSRFNTQQICLECEDKEKKHPLYPLAVQAEADAVKNGDYNFPGIGLPKEL